MTNLFFILILSMSTNAKVDYAKKIHDMCMERFPRTVDKRKLTCDCEARNLKIKANENELKFLADFFRTQKLPTKITDEQNMLVEFSFNVAEECVKNSKWNMEKP